VNGSVDFYFRNDLRFDVVFDFVVFAFEIFEDCSFLYDVVGELFPLHVTIAIYVDLIEQISQISDKSFLAIGQLNLPEPKMFGCDRDELVKGEGVALFLELFFEHIDGKLIEV